MATKYFTGWVKDGVHNSSGRVGAVKDWRDEEGDERRKGGRKGSRNGSELGQHMIGSFVTL